MNFSSFSLPYRLRVLARAIYYTLLVATLCDLLLFKNSIREYIYNTTPATVIVVCLFGIMCVLFLFTRLKNEDEIIKNCREQSLTFVFFMYYVLIILSCIFWLSVPAKFEQRSESVATMTILITLITPVLYNTILHRMLEKTGFTQKEIEEHV